MKSSRRSFDTLSVTLAEGDITFLHIGLKGTMNAMFLKELADKTRRGLRGRIETGKSGGGLCYGYRVVRRLENGAVTTGEREINEEEGAIVRRIFREHAAGASPKQIVKALNRNGIPGPQGSLWSPSTIHGNLKRGTGILHNELYVGRLVWNRQRYLKDPDTGKRVARPNPPAQWITKNVPELRIVDDETWQAVQDRYAGTRRKWTAAEGGKRFNQFQRPKYLFSGLTKCGECGAGFIVYSREHLGCFGARGRGTCTNKLTISRREVEERVLRALQERLLREDFFEEFCREFAKEMNRLRMERGASITSAKRELARIEARRKKLIDLVLDDELPASEAKEELLANAKRREELEAQLKVATEPPPLLHPSMADLYRTKVEELAAALQHEDTRLEASETLRGLIDAIILAPTKGALETRVVASGRAAGSGPAKAGRYDGSPCPAKAGLHDERGPAKAGHYDRSHDRSAHDSGLQIELRGNLAAMLTVATKTTRSPETGDLIVPVQLVAGAGFEPATFGL